MAVSDRLDGKVAVVTGGASGFGEATSRQMVAEGAAVVVADIQDDRGTALASELGDRAAYAHTDVTVEAQVAAAVDLAVSEFGRLDCMFNNAGIVGTIGPIDEIRLDEYERTMDVLLTSVFLGMKYAARVMKPQRSGVILSTSSIAGIEGGLGPHIYAAAKTAIVGLTRNVASELGAYGIRVCGIAPGKHVTPMNANVLFDDPDALERAEKFFSEQTPLAGRPGLAEDIAEAAAWLTSDAAGFVSGITLVVDGGLTTGTPEGVEPGWHRFMQPAEMYHEAGRRGGG